MSRTEKDSITADTGRSAEPVEDREIDVGNGEAVLNPFDPARLALSTDYSVVGVKKVLTTVPVRKPSREWWIRTHPNPEFHLQTVLLSLKEERGEAYLVDPEVLATGALAGEPTVGPSMLVSAVNTQGVFFLWQIPMPRDDGRWNEWSRSAAELATAAQTEWIRVSANQGLGAYERFAAGAAAKFGDPVWPEESFSEILKIAFRDHYIQKPDHPVLQRLRGEA